MCKPSGSRTILAFLPMLLSIALAQEHVSLQFLAFPKSLNPEPVELQIAAGKTIKVDTPGNELSPAYQVPKLDSIVVGKTVKNEKNEDVFKVYGGAKAISASKQIVLLLHKGEANSDGFVVLPVDGELANFSGASFLFINASNMGVGGIIGNQKFALKPGQSRLLKPAPDHDSGICQVTLSYLTEEKWKMFYDTRWPANNKYRSIIFFYSDPVSGRLSVTPIVDMLPYKAE